MEGLLLGAGSALWLGILTSISPCPLATNIAAISFICRDLATPRKVLLTGTLYTLGRAVTYVALGALLVGSLLSMPQVSNLLQKYMNKLLGPILILVGMFLLDLLSFRFSFSAPVTESLQKRMPAWGMWGAAPLGMFFALAFCPVSAALFFGSLIPLSLKTGSSVILPLLYGLGTGLPVFVFAVLIALGARSVSQAFDKLTQVEKWARGVTGLIFVAVGIYFSLAYIFGVFS